MKIVIEPHGNQFNVALSSAEGRDPFIVIKGCRLANGRNGEFVSWPATKKEDGKWWNHVFASEAFAAEVLKAAKAHQPQERRSRDDDEAPPF